MLTSLGKELRRIRLDRNEILKTMADKMGVSPQYLSAIENGKRKPTQNFLNTLFSIYLFDSEEKKVLKNAFFETTQDIRIDISQSDPIKKEASLAFAREIDNLNDEEIFKLIKLLNKESI